VSAGQAAQLRLRAIERGATRRAGRRVDQPAGGAVGRARRP
jgi:hypothetical protein